MDWEKLKKQVIHEPKKTLRFIIGLSLTLTVLWVLVLMQTETNGAYVNPNSFTAQPADTTSHDDTVAAAGDSDATRVPLRAVVMIFFGSRGWIFFYTRII